MSSHTICQCSIGLFNLDVILFVYQVCDGLVGRSACQDDLLAELEEMEEEEVKSQLLDIGGTSTLPSLPEPSNIEPRIGQCCGFCSIGLYMSAPILILMAIMQRS